MFEDLVARVGASPSGVRVETATLPDLFATGGGMTIGNGLLRIHTAESAGQANDLVGTAYPEYVGRIYCFAFDWLGRQFSVDLSDARDVVHEFEIGAGEVLEMPVDVETFLNDEVVDYPDDTMAESYFTSWIAAGGRGPGFEQCVGYKKPLFLGGADDVTNLELSDISVYWTIVGQLRLGTVGLPPGTSIRGVNIEWFE